MTSPNDNYIVRLQRVQAVLDKGRGRAMELGAIFETMQENYAPRVVHDPNSWAAKVGR